MNVMSFSFKSLANSAFSDRKLCRASVSFPPRKSLEAQMRAGVARKSSPVTGMDGLSARLAANVDIGLFAQVRLSRRRRTDIVSLVGLYKSEIRSTWGVFRSKGEAERTDHLDMHGMPIRIRVDGDGLDSEAAGGANDTAGNFATVMTVDWVSSRHGQQCSQEKIFLPFVSS